MKTKLILSTEIQDVDYWTELPILPRINEWLNVKDIIGQDDTLKIKQSARCWSGSRGVVQSVELRREDSVGFYPEIYVWCED